MQDNTRASPQAAKWVAAAVVAVAIAALAWMAGSALADAANTGASGTSRGPGQFQPIQQSYGQDTPNDTAPQQRDGRPCPGHGNGDGQGGGGAGGQGSGGSGQQAPPSQSTTPSTDL